MRIIALLLMCVFVAACGRGGSPELPASAFDEPRAPRFPTEPDGETVPDRPFVGDRILQ